jgi:hypothetical protein
MSDKKYKPVLLRIFSTPTCGFDLLKKALLLAIYFWPTIYWLLH